MAPMTRSKMAAPGLFNISEDDAPAVPVVPAAPKENRTAPNDATSLADSEDSFDTVPPVYTIDLSLPPAQRYIQVAKDYKLIVEGLVTLFDELLDSAKLPKKPMHWIAKVLLRRLYSKEQTEELRGISKVVGVPMYLMVAYNVLLDLFMGCTSGGAVVKEPGSRGTRMMHFRTLDWEMNSLRKAIVQFEYKEKPDGEIVARTINYVGFVGVLTGVRQGLSVSLNFRPYHNNDKSKLSNVKFYANYLLVLLGFRPSICAHLRNFVLPSVSDEKMKKKKKKRQVKGKEDSSHEAPSNIPSHSITDIARSFPSVPTTAAYLIFCDGTQVLVLEKDRVSAKPLTSPTFLTVTNHDTSYEEKPTTTTAAATAATAQSAHSQAATHNDTNKFGTGMQEIVEESMDRKGCMVAKWEKRCRRLRQQGRQEVVLVEQLKEWLLDDPVANEQTHFAAIMDPTKGRFEWVRCFEDAGAEGNDGVENGRGGEMPD
ncbi:beta subunit of N-acylethanolamine-hydrolyzing acid amidase-domain-containing protein [Massariosphaeria phaeospora]|uniref:ceramidase n=1 Tax=Massariosphaeria phaeospora TaxID=100035 RepID=A0A7C8I598_9PLEO|nr:beta subunit of N-acylethanolamine-hydrolyzing acid amidase-domain-containing protein [Massariosphaeria phaeospora]